MQSLEAALDTLQTLKRCHENEETRAELIRSLEFHLKTTIKEVHKLQKKDELIEERLLKIVSIANNHMTFEMDSTGVDDDDDL